MLNRLRFALLALPFALAMGCGVNQPQLARPVSLQANTYAARGVQPDSTFQNDLRRAQYWDPDAVLIMSIQCTALNTTHISAACNVFYSDDMYTNSQPCVLVARHYGFPGIARYSAVVDANDLAHQMKPIGGYVVTADQAFSIAKTFPGMLMNPAPAVPGAAPTAAPAPVNRIFPFTRAFLQQPEQGDPEWDFYATNQKFAIDAQTKAVLSESQRQDPNDRLNSGLDVALQRASAMWLPMLPGESSDHSAPTATN